jgi:hypothetical protein
MKTSGRVIAAMNKKPTISVTLDSNDPDSDVLEMYVSDVEDVMIEHNLTEDEAVQFLVDEHFENKEN